MKNKLVLMLIILVIIPFVIAANKINLQSREISPEDKLTVARYRVENVAKTDLKKDIKNYYIVQFNHILDDNEKQVLEKKGIKIIRYVPEYAWIVSLRSDKYNLLSNYQGLTYIGEYTKEDRMLHSLNTREKTNNFFQKKDNIVKIQGYFFEDNSYEDINSVLSSYNSNYTLDGSYFVINVSIKDISSLAGEQGIEWLTDFFPERTVYNNNARALHGVNIVEALPYNLSGLGVVAAEWDGGWAGNHSDLNGRVTIGDSGCVETYCALDNHAIHVAGTMLGNGSINSSLKGMAPKSTFISYEWFDDLSEFNTEYSQAINTYNATVSQNSWGYSTSPINTANCKALLGNYYTESIWIDNATRGSQGEKITIVWSAGNDRSTNSVYCGSLGFTYNTTTPLGTSKNTITVGAVDDSWGMTSFSSWGPTDDGRLKPDIVANGLGVTSTISANGYGSYNGTSMAAPGVSGVILLLQELYKRHNSAEMDPAIVKNLLIQTAKDLGNTGPDFQNGYGLVNATKGAEYILNDVNQTLIFLNNVTSTGANQTYYFELASGNPELKISLVWNDYPGSPSISKQLLNDLDLIVTNASGNRFYPWTLNTSNHAASAIQTVDDHLNNVEQVYIQNPSSGIWTIVINGSAIPYTNQEFSLITSISDELSPRVTIASPSNQTSYTRSLVDLNYTVIDMNLDKCWFTNSSGQNQTIASCTNQTLTLTDGNHTITFYANDTFGNLVRDEKVFNVTAALPQITFISSVVNGTNITNNFLFVNITTSEIVINATIEADSVNYTMSGSNQNFYYNITGLSLGNNNFSVNVKDIDGNSNNSGLINYVVVAGIPTITLTYPSANQIVNSYTVELNYTLNETNRDRVWYTKNLNSTKIFLNPTQNTGINLQNITFGRTGKQKISVFVNNTLAGINSSNMTFFINQSQNVTEWSQRLSASSANLSTVQILASNNTVLTGNTTLAQQLSIELNFTNITDI